MATPTMRNDALTCEEADKHEQAWLKREFAALRAAGHAMGKIEAPSEEDAAATGLLVNSWQWVCRCGLKLQAGYDEQGTFAVVRGLEGEFPRASDYAAAERTLHATMAGPCPVAHAQASFHESVGYQRFAEAFND